VKKHGRKRIGRKKNANEWDIPKNEHTEQNVVRGGTSSGREWRESKKWAKET